MYINIFFLEFLLYLSVYLFLPMYFSSLYDSRDIVPLLIDIEYVESDVVLL